MKSVFVLTLMLATALAQPVLAAENMTRKPSASQTATPKSAQMIHVGVNGMVCDFCAQTLKKTFAKKAGIQQVDISLEDKMVTLHVPAGTQIDDATITKLIGDAGYAVTTIHRM